MDLKKPVVFVTPMSIALSRLKEILEATQEEDGIEIFEVGENKEFGQLVGNIGQALILTSNAKTCVTLLQENKNFIFKNKSKMILMTPKEIPTKTLQKFTKIGLTECILDNAPPKTLIYKIKLLIKSLKAAKGEDENAQVVKSMLDLNQAEIDLKEKDHNLKQENEESLDYGLNRKKETNLEIELNPEEEKRKKILESIIDSHWKNDKKKPSLNLDIEMEDNQAKKSFLDEEYYEHQKNHVKELILEAGESTINRESDESESELFQRTKRKINELELDQVQADDHAKNLDQDETSSLINKREMLELNIEPEKNNHQNLTDSETISNNKSKNEELNIEHSELQPKIKSNVIEIETAHQKDPTINEKDEEAQSNKRHHDLNLTDNDVAALDATKESVIELRNKKSSYGLDIEEEPKDKYNKITDQSTDLHNNHQPSTEVNIELTNNERSKALSDHNIEDKTHSRTPEISFESNNTKENNKALDLDLENPQKEMSHEGNEHFEKHNRARGDLINHDTLDENNSNLSDQPQTTPLDNPINKTQTLDIENNSRNLNKNPSDTTITKDNQFKSGIELEIEKQSSKREHESDAEHIISKQIHISPNKRFDWEMEQNTKSSNHDYLQKLNKDNIINIDKNKVSKESETLDYKKIKEAFYHGLDTSALSENNSRGKAKDLIQENDEYHSKKVYIENGLSIFIKTLDLIKRKYKATDILKKHGEFIFQDKHALLLVFKKNHKISKFEEYYNSSSQLIDQLSKPHLGEIEKIAFDKKLEKFQNFKSNPKLIDALELQSLGFWFSLQLENTKSDQVPFWYEYELTPSMISHLKDKELAYAFPHLEGGKIIAWSIYYFEHNLNQEKILLYKNAMAILSCLFMEGESDSNSLKVKIEKDEAPSTSFYQRMMNFIKEKVS